MMFSFRVPCELGTTTRLRLEAPEWVLSSAEESTRVVLRSADQRDVSPEDRKLCLARRLELRGSGYLTTEAAIQAGELWQSHLMRIFACAFIGADFGHRAAWTRAGASDAGLAMLEAQHQRPAMVEHAGVTVYETTQDPLFFRFEGSLTVSSEHHHLVTALENARKLDLLPPEQQTAFDLYSASFFQTNSDARFILLMMAYETMLSQTERSSDSVAHVETLIALTKNTELRGAEKQSLVSSLEWLKVQSIGQAGRELANTMVGRTYMGKTPAAFFSDCYECRSALAHGHYPRPDRTEVDVMAAALTLLVGDIIAGPLVATHAE